MSDETKTEAVSSEVVAADSTTTEKTAKKSSKSKKAEKVESAAAEPRLFAVVRTGGKQYRVTAGTKLCIEKLEVEAGSSITIEDVIMVGKEGGADVKIAATGSALSAKVTAKVLGQEKDKKVIIFKKRRRGGYTKKQGHRQNKTEVLIESISL